MNWRANFKIALSISSQRPRLIDTSPLMSRNVQSIHNQQLKTNDWVQWYMITAECYNSHYNIFIHHALSRFLKKKWIILNGLDHSGSSSGAILGRWSVGRSVPIGAEFKFRQDYVWNSGGEGIINGWVCKMWFSSAAADTRRWYEGSNKRMLRSNAVESISTADPRTRCAGENEKQKW